MAKAAARSPWLALAFRVYLGGLFIDASLYKISYAGEFAEVIASYRLAPWWSVAPLAVVLPWVELVSGGLLVVGLRSKAAAGAVFGMLALFTVAIASALIRDLPMGCGCFHSLEEPMSWATLARDLAWLGMAAHVYRYDRLLQLERTFLAGLQRRMPE
jgi:uncharacterized membrane protein YphA (DoxX/SURF4 family)